MSVAEKVKSRAMEFEKGEPFTNGSFLSLGSRSAVDKALSRLVEEGGIQRAARGVYFRPKKSRFVGVVLPELSQVVRVIAQDHGETIQVHGAEAARRFKLSTQMPTIPTFYTSGPSRELHIGKLRVRLMHTTSSRRLQHAGSKVGLALSALWYLGKESVSKEAISRVREGLSEEEFTALRESRMPAWMSKAIKEYSQETAHG